MKKLLLRTLFFLIPFLYSIYVSSQPKKEKDCSTTCFSSEVVSAEKITAACAAYELKVSFSGDCAHALSHYTVAVPCGTIENLWNSQSWAQETGTDPTSGLKGFKIDNISGFGEGSLQSFTVKFNVCSTGEDCADQLICWQPQVAYKASTCINYETLSVSCRSLKASLEKQDASCFGANDGSLNLIIEEGQEPYAILWSDQSTSLSRPGLGAGTYSVTVRDQSGMELTLEETIYQPEAITLTGATTAASCNGVADGSIALSVSGGAGDYSFLWSNGADTEDLQDLTPGSYTVSVTDAQQCVATKRFTVGKLSTLQVTATQLKPACNQMNGSIDIDVTGGTAPYSFVWSNSATSEDLHNIGAGIYSVTVTDAKGCSEKISFLLKEDNTLSLAAKPTHVSCTEESSGALDLSVSGGTEPYTFLWSNGATTEDLSGLAEGYYTVKVTDANGCTVSTGYTISKSTFQVPRVVIQPSCHGENNGSITLQEPIGGTAPFSYVWSDGYSGTSQTGLAPGSYSVTVTDATGCKRFYSINILEPSEISVSASVTNQDCNAEGAFAIDLEVSGGTAPYNFEWMNGSTLEDLSELESGSYSVIVTDARGCKVTREIVIGSGTTAWTCRIDQPEASPICSSANNSLSSSVKDADAYSWHIESADDSWVITNGENASSIVFTAGSENTSATFTLTLEKDGCTKTCSYTVTSCNPEGDENGDNPDEEDPDGGEDPGSEDPDGEDPDGDGDEPGQSCEECFSSIATLVDISDDCRTYEMVVRTNGLCRHDLSHWTVAIPCGSVRDYSNSEGWKMEFGQDPTTGLYGLKVDDINHFGKEADSFTVTFTVCGSDDCDPGSWNPEVAYKAAQCVGKEIIDVIESAATFSAYPNPFNETVNFEWRAADDRVNLQIIDQYGNTLATITSPSGKDGSYYIRLDTSSLPRGMYYYRLTIDGKTHHGKISRR